MKIKGWDLNYFNTGEWQVVNERLQDLDKIARRIGNSGFNPERNKLFNALQSVPCGEVKVCILGQDPYPEKGIATGIAFAANAGPGDYPQTLRTLFQEYCSDLHFELPSDGSLAGWTKAGVLLWNAIPSCGPGKSLSHDWLEWEDLTREIVRSLSARGIVFALLGQVARRFERYIDLRNNQVIVTSHPSPRGQISAKTPFLGSRLFSTINAKLIANGQEPIDWKLL